MVSNNPHPTITVRYFLASFLGLGFGILILFFSFFSSGVQSFASFPDSRLMHPLAKMMQGEMIPGNPMYPIFVGRERVRLLFTKDRSLRVRMQIEFARERLTAADKLFQRGESSLAITTLSKAETYLGQAASELMQKDRDTLPQGGDIQSLVQAIDLHLTYMSSMKEHLSDEEKSRMDGIEYYTRTMRTTLEGFFHTSFFKTSSTM